MNCALYQRYVGHLLDGEVDTGTQLSMAAHEASCEQCREYRGFESTMKRMVQEAITGPAAPAGLRERILSEVSDDVFPASQSAESSSSGIQLWHVLPVAAAALLMLGIFPLASYFGAGVSEAPEVAGAAALALRDTVRLHRSALPADIESAAPHAVPRYFAGKVDFPVRPAHFSEAVRLVGARLSHIGSRRAAALYYRAQDRRLTVVIVEDESRRLVTGATPWASGLHPVHYRRVHGHTVPIRRAGGLTYIFAGDLAQEEMLRLASSARFDP